ncbi:sulfotransferase family protein [Lonsdalea quercina]|uniref:sulfotransferase family protein n=1 Tax=Lonsdalea quercina TaxID=71657 RepID=UPI0039770E40
MKPEANVKAPVLLGGENRSGTTLQSIILDAHPDLVVAPEIDFLEPLDLGPHILEAARLLSANDPRVLGPGTETEDPFWFDGAHFVKQCQRSGVPNDDLIELVKAAMAERKSDLSRFVDRCYLIEKIGAYRLRKYGGLFWGQKLQRKIARIDDFARIWPEARFIHIVRDGRDLFASHLKSVPKWGYKTPSEMARGWVEIVSRPVTVAPQGRYLEIRYEDLVTSPAEVIKRMTDFIGVEWSDQVLAHHEVSHVLFENPWDHPAAEAAAKAISTSPVGRYQRDLSERQIAEFEAVAGPQLKRLGYTLSDGSR